MELTTEVGGASQFITIMLTGIKPICIRILVLPEQGYRLRSWKGRWRANPLQKAILFLLRIACGVNIGKSTNFTVDKIH
jgi:hypothetical protein